ncbi:MAG: putative CRISPR-associated protein [Desulfamplus sp.]|nr:putative CRISPR-associated protein [Desulfamplus sp.]
MRDILISTAGTSLLFNIKNNILNSSNDKYSNIKKYFVSNESKNMAEGLCQIADTDRVCGAEINSVEAILSQGLLNERFYHFILVSDTQEGQIVGNTLLNYYSEPFNKKNRFQNVKIHKVDGLNSDNAKRFKNEGLKNLVRLIVSVVRNYGSERILINATGGYKAQISFAGMIGQALCIPVCYMFEGFNEVITLPPQPLSFDFEFWLQYYEIFSQIDNNPNNMIEFDKKWELPDDRFDALVDYIQGDGKYIYELTPTGLLFHETFRSRFKSKKELLPADSQIPIQERKIVYEDKNANKHKGLPKYLEKILKASFVNRIYIYYYNRDLEKQNIFRRTEDDKISEIDGWYSNDGAITKFTVRTTAETLQQRNAAIAWLNESFAS